VQEYAGYFLFVKAKIFGTGFGLAQYDVFFTRCCLQAMAAF
jgi:hypothetical protein